MEQIGHRAARNRDTESPILLLQSIERDRVAALAHDQMCNEARAVLRLVRRALRRRRVDDVLAAPAGQRLASEDAPAEVARDVLKHGRWLAVADAAKLGVATMRARALSVRNFQLDRFAD